MATKRFIEVSKDVREGLKKAFRTTNMSIWRALSFNDNSEKSRRMRRYALLNGGIVMVTSPEVETIHNESDGCMRQYFPNGAMIEVDKHSGHLDVFDKSGRRVQGVEHDCSIPQLYVMQEFAANL